MQKVRAGRFDTSKFINSNVRDGQNENIEKLGNLYSGQVKLEGGEQKAEKTEKTTEEKEKRRMRRSGWKKRRSSQRRRMRMRMR